jgi:transglutaminase-like putative cysteine protease
MKKIISICILAYTSLMQVFANNGEYALSKIPPALLKNAHVVKRMEEERFSLKNASEATYYHKYVLTILNENGDKHAGFYQYYDRFVEIKSIEGILYDAEGNEIKKLKSKDIQDLSGVSDISLMEDNRVKFHSFYYKAYPYTVEYTLEMKYNGTMFFPYWLPVENEHFAVQQSKFIFECPMAYEFRYKAFGYKGEPVTEMLSDKKRSVWELKDLNAIVKEQFSPDFRKLTTFLMLGPTEFEMQNYKGNMKSWQDLGKFIYTLKQGRDVLPDDIKIKVHELIYGLSDPKEKIRKLYEYMQKNTRYVSIQLGIGGWQPFTAEYVAKKGYGDCKALSNYMFSLLKEAGIKSFYTVIGAGSTRPGFETEFPASQFNHVILCATVNAADTVWLECTSQTMPSGYLGDFTSDRYALLVDEDGGKLIRTPKYGIYENLQNRVVKAQLNTEGVMNIEIKTSYGGMQQDNLHMLLNNLSKDKVKEYLDKELDFATYTVNNFDYKENKGELPGIEEKLSVTVDHYATISGKRLFIIPNIITRSHRKLKADEERKFDIELGVEYRDIDKAEIEIPAGYKPESVPQDMIIESKFGKYKSSVKLDKNKIVYERSMEQYSGLFSKDNYAAMVKFYDDIYKADRNKLVFLKTEEEVKKPF